MSKIERKPILEAEQVDLHDQIELYLKSNPGYATKNDTSKVSEADANNRVVSAFRLAGQLATIHSLLQADNSFVEISENQRAALESLANSYNGFYHGGIKGFQDQSHIGEFAEHFAALAAGSDDLTNGVSFKDLRQFIQHSLSDADLLAKTNQRIANKQLEKEKHAEAEKAEAKAEVKAEKEQAKEPQAEPKEDHTEQKEGTNQKANEEEEETKGGQIPAQDN